MPVTNVDGLAGIEQLFNKTGEWLARRKNMNFEGSSEDQCSGAYEERGVDINRNYRVDWNKNWNGGNSEDPCAQNYRGAAPFSEPELRAVRDFVVTRKEEIKFLYNFHSYGNMYLWPYNGSNPDDIETRSPGVLDVFMDICT